MFKHIKKILNPAGETPAEKTPQQPDVMPVQETTSMNGLLTGKNVLITGAGRNIGRSIALEMASQGAHIFFTDIHDGRCSTLETEMRSQGYTARGFTVDSSAYESIDAFIDVLSQQLIQIDIMVNNVGITPVIKPFHEVSAHEWETVMNTNLLGPVYLTRHIIKHMVDNEIRGSVLFITSIHQEVVFGAGSYSSSKAAVAMLIKELSMDYAAHGIRVNGIAPGWVIEDKHGIPLPHESTPLHNTSINPCYIGRGAVYLSSDYFSRFTTGTIIKIDGGLSLHSFLTTDPG